MKLVNLSGFDIVGLVRYAHPNTPMAIDSVRLLTDSAAQIWRGLSRYSSIESLTTSDCFDEWIIATASGTPLDRAEEQSLRREYRRLTTMIDEIETLVRSRSRAIDLVRSRMVEDALVS